MKNKYRSVVSFYLSCGMQLTNYVNGESIEEIEEEKAKRLENLKETYPTMELIIFSDTEEIVTTKIEGSGEHHILSELTNPQIERKYFKSKQES